MPRCFTHASRRVYRPPHVASLRVKIPSCARRISAVTCFLASHEAQRTCGRGGIGRRVRFRSVWGQPHGGSSPLARTIANSGPGFGRVFCCPASSPQLTPCVSGDRETRIASASTPKRVGAGSISGISSNNSSKSRCFQFVAAPSDVRPGTFGGGLVQIGHVPVGQLCACRGQVAHVQIEGVGRGRVPHDHRNGL